MTYKSLFSVTNRGISHFLHTFRNTGNKNQDPNRIRNCITWAKQCSETALSARVSATCGPMGRPTWTSTRYCWYRVWAAPSSMQRGKSSGLSPGFGSGFYLLIWSSGGSYGLFIIRRQVCESLLV